MLLAPDSFKGSLDAPAVARHMAEGPASLAWSIARGGPLLEAAAAQLVRLYAAARRSA